MMFKCVHNEKNIYFLLLQLLNCIRLTHLLSDGIKLNQINLYHSRGKVKRKFCNSCIIIL